jgi:hypothetical protein
MARIKQTARESTDTLSPRGRLLLEAKLPQRQAASSSQGSTELYEYDTKIMKAREELIRQYKSYEKAETKKGKKLSTQQSLLRKLSCRKS